MAGRLDLSILLQSLKKKKKKDEKRPRSRNRANCITSDDTWPSFRKKPTQKIKRKELVVARGRGRRHWQFQDELNRLSLLLKIARSVVPPTHASCVVCASRKKGSPQHAVSTMFLQDSTALPVRQKTTFSRHPLLLLLLFISHPDTQK